MNIAWDISVPLYKACEEAWPILLDGKERDEPHWVPRPRWCGSSSVEMLTQICLKAETLLHTPWPESGNNPLLGLRLRWEVFESYHVKWFSCELRWHKITTRVTSESEGYQTESMGACPRLSFYGLRRKGSQNGVAESRVFLSSSLEEKDTLRQKQTTGEQEGHADIHGRATTEWWRNQRMKFWGKHRGKIEETWTIGKGSV